MTRDHGSASKPDASGGEFYAALAPVMAAIFPLAPDLASLIDSLLSAQPQGRLLDLGAGTGELALHVAGRGGAATAVEPVAEMVGEGRRSAARRGLDVRWITADLLHAMRELAAAGEGFAVATCVGNTLPHLASRELAGSALGEMHNLLVPGGTALVQTIHVDRCLARGGLELPERTAHVAGRRLVLRRSYMPAGDGEYLRFTTEVELNGEQRRFELRHLALRAAELEELARRAGFAAVAIYGGYDRSPWSTAAPGTVLLARRAGAG